MGLLSMNAEQLRYKMKHLNELCPNRSVTNDDEFYELYSKLRDLIDYAIRIYKEQGVKVPKALLPPEL